jgi:transposase-like protein
MTKHTQDDLWRDFPKTATEFEKRFATEEDCRAYWIEARWAATRRTGISAMDLMRIMGFGSYKTAWTWLHKLRAALVRPQREPLGPFVQMDEALVGGKGGPHKELVLVAAEADGRVRLAHAETNDKATLKRFADGQIAPDARVVTDGLASYDADSLGDRPHEAKVQTKAERRENDAVQSCHWTISLLKRWLLGTHAGAVRPKHLQAYLDEYAFRHNRRRTNGVGRIAARVIERLVARPPLTMRTLIDDTRPCRWFPQPELRA